MNRPAFPVIFSQTIFNADDGILIQPAVQIIGKLMGCERTAFRFKMIFAITVKLGSCSIQTQINFLPIL